MTLALKNFFPNVLLPLCLTCSAWTIELASLLPLSATLSGFDITASNYPAPEWLPSNVSMHVMNAFTLDLPEHLVGVFDVVHIRAIVSAIKGNAVEPLLKNLVKMLSMLPPSSCNSHLHYVPGVYDNGIYASMLSCKRLSYADLCSLLRRAWRVSAVG
jgi:hypothetical protein